MNRYTQNKCSPISITVIPGEGINERNSLRGNDESVRAYDFHLVDSTQVIYIS